MKIQHWFFLKLKPKTSMSNTKSNQRKKTIGSKKMSTQIPSSAKSNFNTKNSEQAILDACWSTSTVGTKLKSKIMERMKYANKATKYQPQSATNRPKTPGRISGLGKPKNKGKKDMSKLILMIQESNKGKRGLSKISSCRDLNRSMSRPQFLAKQDSMLNSAYASNTSMMNTSIQEASVNSGMRRDASAYLTLREQLNKITMEINAADNNIEKQEESFRKQRRTRKERGKGMLKRDSSMAIDTLNTLLIKKDADILNSARAERKTPVIKQISKNFDNKEKLKTQPRLGILLNTKHQIFKENKPCLNPTPRTVLKNDPIKHLIRKHLGDLYSKIMLKIGRAHV